MSSKGWRGRGASAIASTPPGTGVIYEDATRVLDRLRQRKGGVEEDEQDDVTITPVAVGEGKGEDGAWSKAMGFKDDNGEILVMPKSGQAQAIGEVLLRVSIGEVMWAGANAAEKLPNFGGTYILDDAELSKLVGEKMRDAKTDFALGFALGCYSFNVYKTQNVKSSGPSLYWPDGCDEQYVRAAATGLAFARDLVNLPPCDLGPQELVREALALAAAFGCETSVTHGEKLLNADTYYPAVHTVGRASTMPPAVVSFSWSPREEGSSSLPLVTLVGKGVTFDTGGLNLKPGASMRLMKKDMGGAALVLGLAHMIMSMKLAVRLRVIVPTVENSVAGNAFRPSDVLRTRKGITVENGNTDAEGRLILCDALAKAEEENPDLLIDAATLTGAARVALGPDLPALFCTDDSVAQGILDAGVEVGDELWRLPLHRKYNKLLESKVADLQSCPDVGGYAGAITAALFLQKFVSPERRWVHIDTMGYNTSAFSSPGRPEGGEGMAMRALFSYLAKAYPSSSA